MTRLLSITLLACVLTLVFAGAAHAQAPAQPMIPPVRGTHYVLPSETLYCIGRAYMVDPWTIAAYNPLPNPNSIAPYTPLTIPNAPTWTTPGRICTPQTTTVSPPYATTTYPPYCSCPYRYYYTVVPGDTLNAISWKTGVYPGTIASCNGLYNWNMVYAYSQLCIP